MNVVFVIFLMIFSLVLYSTVRKLRASKSNESVPPDFAGHADFSADGSDSGLDPPLPAGGHSCHHHGAGDHGSSHDATGDAGHGFFDGGHGGFDGGGHH
jgi:hypothetical protein